MKKRINEVIKQNVKQSFLDVTFFTVKIIGFFILFIILYKNILASQVVSPLYFQIFNPSSIGVEDRQAVVVFLKKIEVLPDYERYLFMASNIYGEEIEEEINKDHLNRKSEIDRFEAVLLKNPKSRDVLYVLSKLYEAQRDEAKANFYLEQAKEIDPNIK